MSNSRYLVPLSELFLRQRNAQTGLAHYNGSSDLSPTFALDEILRKYARTILQRLLGTEGIDRPLASARTEILQYHRKEELRLLTVVLESVLAHRNHKDYVQSLLRELEKEVQEHGWN